MRSNISRTSAGCCNMCSNNELCTYLALRMSMYRVCIEEVPFYTYIKHTQKHAACRRQQHSPEKFLDRTRYDDYNYTNNRNSFPIETCLTRLSLELVFRVPLCNPKKFMGPIGISNQMPVAHAISCRASTGYLTNFQRSGRFSRRKNEMSAISVYYI